MYVIGRTRFNEWFLFHVITGNHVIIFHESFFNRRILTISEARVLKEVHILRVTSTITVQSQYQSYQSSKIELLCILCFLNFVTNFAFVTVPHFLLPLFILGKLGASKIFCGDKV